MRGARLRENESEVSLSIWRIKRSCSVLFFSVLFFSFLFLVLFLLHIWFFLITKLSDGVRLVCTWS